MGLGFGFKGQGSAPDIKGQSLKVTTQGQRCVSSQSLEHQDVLRSQWGRSWLKKSKDMRLKSLSED